MSSTGKIEDLRFELRSAVFNVVEYLIKYELSPTAEELILYYFNESHGDTSVECAHEAIEKYVGEPMPKMEDRASKLTSLIDRMEHFAQMWDEESA